MRLWWEGWEPSRAAPERSGPEQLLPLRLLKLEVRSGFAGMIEEERCCIGHAAAARIACARPRTGIGHLLLRGTLAGCVRDERRRWREGFDVMHVGRKNQWELTLFSE